MFCDEIIEKVYLGQPNYDREGNMFLDCYYDMALHITDNYREVLETSSHYISIQYDGVFLLDKTGPITTIEKPNEWLESHYHIDEDDDPDESPWIDYEWTLFVGEKLIAVNKNEIGYTLQFTDFELKVIPHEVDSSFGIYPHSYCHVLGTERLIKPCACGGKGVLEIDTVDDYGIRCEKCHMGTSASMCACDAIDEWNERQDLILIGDYPEEAFDKICHNPFDSITVERNYTLKDDGVVECKEIIVSVCGRSFGITSGYAGNGKYDFTFEEYSAYSSEVFIQQFKATEDEPIRFVERDNENGMPILRFYVGKKQLLITAGMNTITISISRNGEDGEWINFENSKLLNDNK